MRDPLLNICGSRGLCPPARLDEAATSARSTLLLCIETQSVVEDKGWTRGYVYGDF